MHIVTSKRFIATENTKFTMKMSPIKFSLYFPSIQCKFSLFFVVTILHLAFTLWGKYYLHMHWMNNYTVKSANATKKCQYLIIGKHIYYTWTEMNEKKNQKIVCKQQNKIKQSKKCRKNWWEKCLLLEHIEYFSRTMIIISSN